MSRSRVHDRTKIKLASGVTLQLHPFAPLSDRDEVEFVGELPSVVLDNAAERVPLLPAWSAGFPVRLGGQTLEIVVKEVETEIELDALERLRRYHYRGDKTAGRVAPLIACVDHPLLPPVVGFIEITSALLVNTARKAVLGRPFVDPERNVVWQRWDMATAKLQTKRLARISRCVVYPELRGLGVAAILANAAVSFTRDRWHFGGARPLFLEITADMLRYSPFVKGAGFHYVGDTEGNEERVLKDMNYLLRRTIKSGIETDFPKGGGGIMHLQRSYATTLLGVMAQRGINLEQLLKILRRSPETLSDDEWVAMHRVYRRPKPTYMIGLTDAAQVHLKAYMPRASSHEEPPKRSRPRKSGILSVKNFAVSVVATPSGSARARKVAEAFGIVTKSLEQQLFEALSFDVDSTDVVLITGPSGTGKSLLLKLIASAVTTARRSSQVETIRSSGTIDGRPSSQWVELEKSLEAPIDLLKHTSIEGALKALSDAGLAEASLFVRPSNTFSDGQIYRLGIAKALSFDPELMLIDAFCEALDDLSAASVCHKIRSLADRQGVAAIVATASPARLLAELRPNKVVQILPGRTINVISGEDFAKGLLEN